MSHDGLIHSGQYWYILARITDVDGNRYTLASERRQIESINDAPEGTVESVGEAKEGGSASLTVDIDDPDDRWYLEAQQYFYTYGDWYLDGEFDVLLQNRSSLYEIDRTHAERELQARFFYIDGNGTREYVWSDLVAIANVDDPTIDGPGIWGTWRQGASLYASRGNIEDADGVNDITYQWLHDGLPISGAIGDSYLLTQADVGFYVSVRVSYKEDWGAEHSVDSYIYQSQVENVNDSPVGRPVIVGEAVLGNRIEADMSGVSDPDGLGDFSYTCYAEDIAIIGASLPNLRLTEL